MGLAIVRRLSNCLDHKIEHTSKIQRGSRFAVVVKLGTKPKKIKQKIELDSGLLDLKSISVLLVEDDQMVLDATQKLLTSWNCEVICAQSGKDAKQAISKDHNIPDIIIADYSLPGEVNGVQVIDQIRNELGYPVPAFIITGEADTSNIRKISDYGFHVLSKPVHPAKLRALISHLLIDSIEEQKLA